MKSGALLGVACITVFAVSGNAEECPPARTKAAIENLDFALGAPGAPPPGWLLGPEWWLRPDAPAYSAALVSGSSCHTNRQCVLIRSIGDPPSFKLSFLYQLVDAAQYRGARLIFQATVRVDTPGTVARLLVHVHGKNCVTSFRDDMGRTPVTQSAWGTYRVEAPVALDASYLEFGMQLIGGGSAWIDNISMTFSRASR